MALGKCHVSIGFCEGDLDEAKKESPVCRAFLDAHWGKGVLDKFTEEVTYWDLTLDDTKENGEAIKALRYYVYDVTGGIPDGIDHDA